MALGVNAVGKNTHVGTFNFMPSEIAESSEEVRKQFLASSHPRDVAKIFGITYSSLTYHIYRVNPDGRYTTFTIPKKSGQDRIISAPITALKLIQRSLNKILHCVYDPKPSVHGFLYERSIVTNAKIHSGKRYVFNIDLKDFFPSINFGRVRGLFMSFPFNFNDKVSTVLAQICCYNNELPQGAPTSPIISNIICSQMDSELQRFAGQNRCDYTRYADDITFSTYMREFPSALAKLVEDRSVIGKQLKEIIKENGFEINVNKIRLQKYNTRQSVTGLITNEFPNVKRKYVRQIRAMLYAWAKHGDAGAENMFQTKYNVKYRSLGTPAPSFKKVLRGKIEFLGMVRGKDDPIYSRYRAQYDKLDPDCILDPAEEAVPMEFDAFISHASEDKKNFVNPLVKALERKGYKIWYDEYKLDNVSDFIKSLDHGLANSRYGVVVFSKSFFTKDWTRLELSTLINLEIHGRAIILPIFYNVDVREVLRFSPLSVNRLALEFPKLSIKEIADKLSNKLKIKRL